MDVTLKVIAKAKSGKAFKADDNNWYNVEDKVIPYLEKINKGDTTIVTYRKVGTVRIVDKIVKADVETKKEEPKYVCEDCGKALKDNKYKKCYTCNQKSPKTETKTNTGTNNYSDRVVYGSPEDVAGKEVGCALNSASRVASGQQFSDPETAVEYTLILAEKFLDWTRAKK